jgi:hypothetical protein
MHDGSAVLVILKKITNETSHLILRLSEPKIPEPALREGTFRGTLTLMSAAT